MTDPTPAPSVPPGHEDIGHELTEADWFNVQRDRDQWLTEHSHNHLSGPPQ